MVMDLNVGLVEGLRKEQEVRELVGPSGSVLHFCLGGNL